ncbi:C40 family peptidase [Streptomyces sp. NPDC058751]|uniref:C40 family peptidase n=1 Tax=Streptomyces sp. NPDC058751 TaxID=3346623 RepID=UPI00369D1C08
MAPESTPPSSEEVARRLSSLYDQAEFATGKFNGTRASSNSARRPGRGGAGQGSGVSDADRDNLMQQWFDGARSRVGPVAPATLPADRQPGRGGGGGGARPKGGGKGSKGSSSDLPTVYELEQIMRPAAELTAAPMLELTAGPASEPAGRPALELTAGPAAGSPAVPGPGTGFRAALPAVPAQAAAPQKPSPQVKKQNARRKLAAAQELMSRHVSRQNMPVAQAPAIEYRPTEQPRLPSAPQTGTFPSVGQTGTFPSVPQGVGLPSAAQTGTFPSVGQTGTFPSVPQGVAFPSAPQTGTFPSVGQTGTFPSVPQSPAFQPAPQPAAFQAAPPPQVFETGSVPRAYEPAPATAEVKSVLLPLGYEPPPPASEVKSVLLPLSYETPARPSGYQPPPAPPVSEPVPQPPVPQSPVYESTPPPAAYPSAPMPPVAPSAPMPPAAPSAPMPPAAPPVDDAWRQSLRTSGGGQAWPAAPGATDANPGFDIDRLVAGAAAPPATGQDSRAAEAVAFARAQIGSPCVWGASGPGSYDPSGLTQAAWKSAGVMLPRTTQDQAQAGPTVDLGAVQPGDLVFFHANVSHVGLYVGDGMMVHAPSPGARISEEPVEYVGREAIHSVVRPV